MPLAAILLVRHGETAWSRNGQHTGRTDVPLTAHGEAQARALAPLLRTLGVNAPGPSQVLVSPLQRARRTCELAGCAAQAQVDAALCEWNYGDYEGLTGDQIHAQRPDWDVFRDGCPGGESSQQMCQRVDGVVAQLRTLRGNVVVFSHGHFLRALAVRWIGLPLLYGRNFGLKAGAVSALGYEHDSLQEPAIELWNFAASQAPVAG